MLLRYTWAPLTVAALIGFVALLTKLPLWVQASLLLGGILALVGLAGNEIGKDIGWWV